MRTILPVAWEAPPLTCRIVLETDAAAIASRVSRPKADTTDIVINEQTIKNACECSRLPMDTRIRNLLCWSMRGVRTDVQTRH